MNQHSLSFAGMTKKPSALLPLLMSFVAFAVVLGSIGGDLIQNGHILRGGDEGAEAHIWQLLMAAQVPAIAFFAIRWLRQAPRQTTGVLALQAGGILANLAVVFFARL